MLSETDQTELTLAALQKLMSFETGGSRQRTHDDGTKEIA
jgi:hypothetical protein